MPKQKVLIIDAQNWAHRAYHAMSRMQWKGKPTGAIWGFINMLDAVVRVHKPNRIYACWDDGCDPHRLKLLPTYKKRDPKIDFDREDFVRQTEAIRKMLYYLGIPSLHAPQREADDFIYLLTKKYLKKGWKIRLGSGDKDFRQLVSNDVFIIDDKHGLITPKNFKKKFGIDPPQYSDYLCLLGDSSDKIPGVRGFGEVTTLKFIEDYGTVKNYLDICKAQGKEIHKKHKEIVETVKVNHRLINLAHFDQCYGPFKPVFYLKDKKPRKQPNNYIKRCQRYGIRKFITQQFIKSIP